MSLASATGVSPGAEARSATVNPGPTARNASVWTEISFRGVPAGKAGRIFVRGGRSGVHGFSRKRHADNRGFSLVMKRPFRTSERVLVKTHLTIPGARRGDYRFQVENMGGPRPGRQKAYVLQPAGDPQFRSRPDLRPPRLEIRKNSPDAANLPLLIGSKVRGSTIYTADGEPIWFRAMRSTDFRRQTYRGKPVLTWFQAPTKGSGLARSTYVIANAAYKTIRKFVPGNGYSADSHEFRLTDRGTAYITTYRTVRRNLTSKGMSANGRVSDSVAQEIDLRTGRVVWEWHSLDHVPIKHSAANGPRRPGNPYDYFHINSIIDTPDGNVMISGRSVNAIYKISRRTGRVIWTLGGRGSDFKLGPGAQFSWQHDAQPLSGNRVSLFDNADAPVADKPWAQQSRGLILQLDNKRKTATVDTELLHPRKPLSPTQANVELLDNGNYFVGWGQTPIVSEHAPDGALLFDATVLGVSSFYRAFREPWVGHPTGPVDFAAQPVDGSSTRLWVSWNGDSSVRTWRVLAGPSRKSLTPVDEHARDGFETQLLTATGRGYVKVQGLNAAGKVIGSSRAEKVR